MSIWESISRLLNPQTAPKPSNLIKSDLKIPSRHGDTIYADLSQAEQQSPKALMICVHGVKGFKDWGFWNPFAQVAAEAGFCVLKFNFALNGMSETDMENFPLLDNFARNTLSRELEDLTDVLDYVGTSDLKALPIYLVAHSRGGGIATLTTAKDPRIQKLVTWNAVGDYQARLTEAQVLDWESKGYIEMENARTKQMMRINKTYLEDLTQNANRLDIPEAAKKIQVPWLIIHATDDTVVPFSNAEIMFNLNESSATILHEATGGHAFGATHPPKAPLEQSLLAVFDKSLSFLGD